MSTRKENLKALALTVKLFKGDKLNHIKEETIGETIAYISVDLDHQLQRIVNKSLCSSCRVWGRKE